MERCIIRISETYGPGDMRLLKLFRGVQTGRYVTARQWQERTPADLCRRSVTRAFDGGNRGRRQRRNNCARRIGTRYDERDGQCHWRRREPATPGISRADVAICRRSIRAEKTMTPLGLKPPLHRRRLDFFRSRSGSRPRKPRNFSGSARRRISSRAPAEPPTGIAPTAFFEATKKDPPARRAICTTGPELASCLRRKPGAAVRPLHISRAPPTLGS